MVAVSYGDCIAVGAREEGHAEAACEVERIICGHAIAGWRVDDKAQKRMRHDICLFHTADAADAQVGVALGQGRNFINQAILITKGCIEDC